MADSTTGKSAPKEKSYSLRRIYLIFYNSVLTVTWTLVLLKALVFISENNTFHGLYKDVEYWLKISQAAAILEVLHAAVGLVRSSAATTAMQVASRLFTLFVAVDRILMPDSEGQNAIGFPMLLFAWTVTEIVRYSFYTHTLLENCGAVLQWLRYSLFIVLYPLGVSGELLCIYSSMPIEKRTNMMSYRLPNPINVSFDYSILCYVAFVAYVPGFYILYAYMLGQRKKILGAAAAVKGKEE